MRNVVLFGTRFWLYRRLERRDKSKEFMRFSSNESALRFLRNARSGGSNMQVLRKLLNESFGGSDVHSLDDNRVLAALSKLLFSGRLEVHENGDTYDRSLHSTGASQGLLPVTAPRREPRPMPPPTFKPKAVPPPAPDVDVAQQVAVLEAAAKSGAPFCEKCEKAKQKREAA